MFEGLFGGNSLVAIDIGTSSIKLAELDTTSRGATLKKFAVYPVSPGSVNGGELVEVGGVSQAIENALAMSKTKRKSAASAIWGNAVIVKKIAMPKTDPKLIGEALRWEAEQYIPFDINEISLDHHILNRPSGQGESMEVLLVAAKQEPLFRILEAIEMAKVKCSVIDVAGFALANCFEANYGVIDSTIGLLNFGAGVTNFVVIDRGQVVFSRDISVGGGQYTMEIQKSMSVSASEAEALKISASLGQEAPAELNRIIANVNEQSIDEIKNSFEFYGATASGAAITKLFISGGSVFLPGLVEQVSKVLNIPFEPLDPFLRVSYDTKIFSADYIDQIKAISPVAIGLGLRKPNEK